MGGPPSVKESNPPDWSENWKTTSNKPDRDYPLRREKVKELWRASALGR